MKYCRKKVWKDGRSRYHVCFSHPKLKLDHPSVFCSKRQLCRSWLLRKIFASSIKICWRIANLQKQLPPPSVCLPLFLSLPSLLLSVYLSVSLSLSLWQRPQTHVDEGLETDKGNFHERQKAIWVAVYVSFRLMCSEAAIAPGTMCLEPVSHWAQNVKTRRFFLEIQHCAFDDPSDVLWKCGVACVWCEKSFSLHVFHFDSRCRGQRILLCHWCVLTIDNRVAIAQRPKRNLLLAPKCAKSLIVFVWLRKGTDKLSNKIGNSGNEQTRREIKFIQCLLSHKARKVTSLHQVGVEPRQQESQSHLGLIWHLLLQWVCCLCIVSSSGWKLFEPLAWSLSLLQTGQTRTYTHTDPPPCGSRCPSLALLRMVGQGQNLKIGLFKKWKFSFFSEKIIACQEFWQKVSHSVGDCKNVKTSINSVCLWGKNWNSFYSFPYFWVLPWPRHSFSTLISALVLVTHMTCKDKSDSIDVHLGDGRSESASHHHAYPAWPIWSWPWHRWGNSQPRQTHPCQSGVSDWGTCSCSHQPHLLAKKILHQS